MSTENTETVISINHVSKVYKLFEKPMDRLKESLSLTHKNYHTDHFALEDISLEVHKGEVCRYHWNERFRKIHTAEDRHRCFKPNERKCGIKRKSQCYSGAGCRL